MSTVRTYIVENERHEILEYTRTLGRAKEVALTYGGTRIIMMQGPSFGEGFHKYLLLCFNGKFMKGSL